MVQKTGNIFRRSEHAVEHEFMDRFLCVFVSKNDFITSFWPFNSFCMKNDTYDISKLRSFTKTLKIEWCLEDSFSKFFRKYHEHK